MFWQKCGKLLANSNGHLINCDTCPCPYFAVFAAFAQHYKYTYSSSSANGEEDLLPDDVEIQQIPEGEQIVLCDFDTAIQIKQVFQNCINILNYDIRITLNDTGAPVGRDRIGNSAVVDRPWDLIDITVWKLSPCFQNYAEAQAWMDEQANGDLNYWNNQHKKYRGNVDLNITVKGYSDTIYGPNVEQCDTYWQCYDMNTWQLVYEGTEEPQIPQGEEWDCWENWGNCRYWSITTDSGAKFQQMNYDLYPNFEDQMTVAIAELNAYVASKFSSPQSWPVLRTRQNNFFDTCFYDFTITSGYNYWGEDDGCPSARWIWGERAEITLENFDASKHPRGATGAKFWFTYIWADGNQNCQYSGGYLQNVYLNLAWGETYQLSKIADLYAPFVQVECWEEFIGFKSNPCVLRNIQFFFCFVEYTF